MQAGASSSKPMVIEIERGSDVDPPIDVLVIAPEQPVPLLLTQSRYQMGRKIMMIRPELRARMLIPFELVPLAPRYLPYPLYFIFWMH